MVFTMQLSHEIHFDEITIILTMIYLIVYFDHTYTQNFHMIVPRDLDDVGNGARDGNY